MNMADKSAEAPEDSVGVPERAVRISLVAFQDMHHLVLRRLAARAQIRRHAQKLAAWQPETRGVADLDIESIEDTGLHAAIVTDDLGCGPGYRIVFCEQLDSPANGTICIIAILRLDENISGPMKTILKGRAAIAHNRLTLWAE